MFYACIRYSYCIGSPYDYAYNINHGITQFHTCCVVILIYVCYFGFVCLFGVFFGCGFFLVFFVVVSLFKTSLSIVSNIYLCTT